MIDIIGKHTVKVFGNDQFKILFCSGDIRTQPTLVEIFGRAHGQVLLHTLVDLKRCNPTPLHFGLRVFPPASCAESLQA